jgi:hypothetical protein
MPPQFVGLRNDPDGLTGNDGDRTMRDGAKVVSSIHGRHFESMLRNRVFTGVSASAGIALIVPATTGGHPTLWNPSDSGRYGSIVRLELSYVSGNNAPGAVEWAQTLATGAAIATGAPILTGTLVAPVGVVGGALDNRLKWIPTTNTFTAAPAFLRPAGSRCSPASPRPRSRRSPCAPTTMATSSSRLASRSRCASRRRRRRRSSRWP